MPDLLPLAPRVHLKRVDPESAPSPYIMPDAAKEKSVEAVVVAVPDYPFIEYGVVIPCPVRPGQRVLVGKYAGDYKFRNEDVTIVRWDEILAIIAEPKEEE